MRESSTFEPAHLTGTKDAYGRELNDQGFAEIDEERLEHAVPAIRNRQIHRLNCRIRPQNSSADRRSRDLSRAAAFVGIHGCNHFHTVSSSAIFQLIKYNSI